MNQGTRPAEPAPFAADWLALREPFDLAARSEGESRHDLQGAVGAAGGPVRVLDLGCGTGANLRALAPRLAGTQQWTLVDHDPRLLASLAPAMARWCAANGLRWQPGAGPHARIAGPHWQLELHWRQADLVQALDALPLDGQRLVTASALLDLVSEDWLRRLLARAASARVAMLFALTVDGRHDWSPALAGDAQVLARFAAHQLRDKGFGGAALGPGAVACACRHLSALGYSTTQAVCDWRIGPQDQPMLEAMVDGLAEAAMAQAPQDRGDVQAWRGRRLAHLRETHLRVGHVDLLARPA